MGNHGIQSKKQIHYVQIHISQSNHAQMGQMDEYKLMIVINYLIFIVCAMTK